MTEQERIAAFMRGFEALQARYGVLVGATLKQAELVRDGQHRTEVWAELQRFIVADWSPPEPVKAAIEP